MADAADCNDTGIVVIVMSKRVKRDFSMVYYRNILVSWGIRCLENGNKRDEVEFEVPGDGLAKPLYCGGWQISLDLHGVKAGFIVSAVTL